MEPDGSVRATVAPEYPFVTPKPLWAESDPADWWQATVEALRSLVTAAGEDRIVALGLTGQMHGLVMLDAAGEVLRPCIMWNDQRTGAQCAALTRELGLARLLELTGNPVLPGFTAPKVMWVRENEPEIYARTAKILLPKDYIRYRLSGIFATEVSDASGMSLLDVGKRQWSGEMLAATGIPADWLAEVTESTEVSARLSPEAARLTGLPEGLPIVGGGGDQAAQAVGCGIVGEGTVSATLGTSGVVFAAADQFAPEEAGRLHAFCHAVPGKWHYMGVMLSAAGSYDWFREKLAPEKSFDNLNALAADIAPGAEGLIFLPYLSGERTPHPDPLARGAFVGLTLRHDLAHMTRSVLEGVTFGMRDSLELIRGLGVEPTRIVTSGGGARSALWRQMQADIYGVPVVTVNATEGAAYGAALLGAVGVEAFPSVEAACAACLKETSVTEPGPQQAEYERIYPRYRALYPALKEEFVALGDDSVD